jgi:hypothetical protein
MSRKHIRGALATATRRPSRRLGVAVAALLCLAIFAGTARGGAASPATVAFASGPDWLVVPAGETPQSSDRRLQNSLGRAQPVCLNAFAPVPCPSGATLWGYSGFAWGVDLSVIPGAVWVWAPGLSGSDASDLAAYSFKTRFALTGDPVSGTMFIAADDFASVRVNGSVVGTVGSVTNPFLSGHTALVQLDIGPFLRRGTNRIVVTAQNGPAFFAGCSGPCTYVQNPAGVVFGGTISVA